MSRTCFAQPHGEQNNCRPNWRVGQSCDTIRCCMRNSHTLRGTSANFPRVTWSRIRAFTSASAHLQTVRRKSCPSRAGIRHRLAAKGPVEQQVAFFHRMAGHLGVLQRMAEKELQSIPFSDEEVLFLQRTINRKGSVIFLSPMGMIDERKYDGWYPELMYRFEETEQNKWKPTVADVHTGMDEVLEAAVGRTNLCVAMIRQGTSVCTYVGPVLSYYEFSTQGPQRLTDEEWTSRLVSRSEPEHPIWIRDLTARSKDALSAGSPPEVVREGNRLMVTVAPASPWPVPGKKTPIELDDAGIKQLTALAPAVTALELGGSTVTDSGLAELASLEELKVVDLSNTQVTVEGLRFLSNSKHLRRLLLREVAVGDDALTFIAAFRYLETLDLRNSQITDRGLKSLTGLKYLKRLQMEGTGVTAAAVEELQETLVGCRITFGKSDDGIQRQP